MSACVKRDVPLPNYRAAAPSDWMGSRAVEVMLQDLAFPATAGELLAAAGNWRVPIHGSNDTVRMGDLLAEVPAEEEFHSAEEVAEAIRDRHRGF